MGKDPAFLFYPNDWLGGTLGMTFEEKGAYMELLMLQFNRGHMTIDMIGQVIGHRWDKLQSKFIQDQNGLWYNVRLEKEILRRRKFVDSRKNNIEGHNQYANKTKMAKTVSVGHTEGHMVGHLTYHMENETKNENIIEDRGVGEGEEKVLTPNKPYSKRSNGFIVPSIDQVRAYCIERKNIVDPERFMNYYMSNGWKVGKNPMKDWHAAIRTWERNTIPGQKNEETIIEKRKKQQEYGIFKPGDESGVQLVSIPR